MGIRASSFLQPGAGGVLGRPLEESDMDENPTYEIELRKWALATCVSKGSLTLVKMGCAPCIYDLI